MAFCRAIDRWSLCSLVGSFLDLGLAYFFLCAASLVFFSSKFLSFFGLSLPCPCNGLFGHPEPAICVQSLLVEQPTARIASVHRCVRTLSPFEGESVREIELAGDSGLAVGNGNEIENGIGDGSDQRVRCRRSNSLYSSSVESVKSESSVAEPSLSGWKGDGLSSNDSVDDPGEREVPILDTISIRSDESESDPTETIQNLKLALERERSARSALTLELEKERIASATAAEETMSMILRLQKEKSEIEIESRQYKRMTEEKSVYDQEEMEILKEIIVKREMEKFALEKELEELRQMVTKNDTEREKIHLNIEDEVSIHEESINVDIHNVEISCVEDKPNLELVENGAVNDLNINLTDQVGGSDSNEVLVYDVHVVSDKSCINEDEKGKIVKKSYIGESSKAKGKDKKGKREKSRNRSSGDDLRSCSAPAMYIEKLKLENEVEMLRKRLKLIQQGREKFGFPVDQREKEEVQLKLLEEISLQIKEIKNSTKAKNSR